MDFCREVFAPTNDESYDEDAPPVNAELLGKNEEPLPKVAKKDDEEAIRALSEVNARRSVQGMYGSTEHFGTEVIEGFLVRVQRGSLGLIKTDA